MSNELLNKGRTALSVGEWEKARDYFQSALSEDQSPEIYEELGWACWWLNDAAGVFENRTKAFNFYLQKEDKLGSARNACWIAVDYIEFKGEFAIASGWFKRAENLLEGLPTSSELCMFKILKARWTFQVDKNSGFNLFMNIPVAETFWSAVIIILFKYKPLVICLWNYTISQVKVKTHNNGG